MLGGVGGRGGGWVSPQPGGYGPGLPERRVVAGATWMGRVDVDAPSVACGRLTPAALITCAEEWRPDHDAAPPAPLVSADRTGVTGPLRLVALYAVAGSASNSGNQSSPVCTSRKQIKSR